MSASWLSLGLEVIDQWAHKAGLPFDMHTKRKGEILLSSRKIEPLY